MTERNDKSTDEKAKDNVLERREQHEARKEIFDQRREKKAIEAQERTTPLSPKPGSDADRVASLPPVSDPQTKAFEQGR